ncbi:50S ribosomal protein L15 [candidate division WWE3 bacterium CG_4_9_14_3_um_filter_34_6]|uniref:Large ribosomal subunit protein uL15 n=1 Tax=candidate division WWE3 bacterium CG_4_9_14_3_um_filter_34_6 TaxID=1975079 RepID=A0A2M7X399_UNCKA|nr:MAG: 50S ribosomal protein L15 [candidate division WWE3 bacterium CG_4_9_14_3_um_filter_34_6]
MKSILSNLTKSKGYNKPSRRIGRGIGSTKGGHTTGFGMKGQKSRTGGKVKQWFEGGQTPLVHKMPYQGGFVNHAALSILGINVGALNDVKTGGREITPNILVKLGYVGNNKFDVIKILGKGEVTNKINLKGFRYSKRAIEKIKAAGGNAL